MGRGSGVGPPATGTLGLLRSQARLRCEYCGDGEPLAFDLLRAPHWRHVRHHADGATSQLDECAVGSLWDRAVAFLQAPAARCGRCCSDTVAQNEQGVWCHLDVAGRFTDPCERAESLAHLTNRES